MTDRELLELAAKAAGLNVKGEWADEDDKFTHLNIGKKFTNERMKWNPLTDDGDALRLAVKLGLVVHVWLHEEGVSVAESLEHGMAPEDEDSGSWFFECTDSHGGDANKATRRAIVRAAAEIGKAMP